MSIKSTIILTREEAENMYKSFRLDEMREQIEKQFKHELIELNDEELGDKLDEITTDIFSNYLVDDNETRRALRLV